MLPGGRKKISPIYALFIHYYVRDDLLNIEHILNEAKILSRFRIENYDQLFDHIAGLQTEMEQLDQQIKDRTISTEKRAKLQKTLKEKRKELKNEKDPSVRKEIDRIAAEMEAEEKKIRYGRKKRGKNSDEAYIKTKSKKK